ncbi:PadR family transcriptional regulator [Cohnella endophytica]|uniref:PadR family transcriptional regulator n=1 Tax=Cohnella endophytica TaxID=2419778 RepID=A0A494XTQ7_9BACL|nr:helix-turn-helix transcriptional regulator [Cohnella endophytica]RKP53041.1 PadR family transcriptional regulator [Cohnella endophytica]
MNTLSYGLLSLLSHSPLSGYDLTLRIQPFWPAKHSQIYPLLSQMEKDEQVTFETVAQSDKPDKKVYSITDKGIDSLREWLSEPASAPVLRDELMLKAYCVPLVDPSITRDLFQSRLEYYRNNLQRYEEKIRKIKETSDLDEGEVPAYRDPLFGAYILLNKALMSCRTNIEWCEWVLSAIPQDHT